MKGILKPMFERLERVPIAGSTMPFGSVAMPVASIDIGCLVRDGFG